MDDKNSLRLRITSFAMPRRPKKKKFGSNGLKEEVTKMILKRIIVTRSVF